MDYLQLISAIVAIYASIIPFYISKRILPINKRFFVLSTTLGLGLLIHGLYHYMSFLENITFKVSFEFVSALLIFALTVQYMTLRRRASHGG